MRNLKLLVNLNHSLPILATSQDFTVCTLDYNSNIFNRKGYVFIYKYGDIFTLNPVDGDCNLLLSLKTLQNKSFNFVDMFYNSVLNTLIIALESGDVFSVTLDEHFLCSGEVQCVGNIGTGLQAASLSPDSETIVFLTGDNTLILMSGNFDPFQETELFGSDQGEQEMVNVGWGKKETQFHGSEGKAAAKKKSLDEEISTLTVQDQKPKISWRGDSSLFVVSYWCPLTNHHKIKIFDKGGKLQCTSELLPGLEGVLSWRPSGNLIALAQKLPNQHVICFMEKNGLRHGFFALPPNIKVLDLSWNSESTILSAVSVDESVSQPCVMLWTTGNYHWYLKQRLNFTSDVVALHWDDVIGNLVHILLADGSYLAYQWMWTVDHSAGVLDSDLATVAVIDGYDLKLSAFKRCIIPPPMSEAVISLPYPPLQLMFSPVCGKRSNSETSPNDLYVYLSDGQLGLVKGMEESPQLHSVVPVQWKCAQLSLPSLACLSHWLWLSQDKLLCVACSGTSYLCEIQLEGDKACIISTIPLEASVLTISQQTGFPNALVQLRTGEVLVYQDSQLTPNFTLPEPCVALYTTGQHTFGRTHNNHLYVGDELIASNVTSFFYLPQFLVMTLSSHQLCVTSADSGFKIQNESNGTTSRRLERGSLVVMVVGHSVVLQLPRGNLETVQPRSLTLVTAAMLLDAGDYKAVAQLLRRQRINLNLCVDHNPSAFLLSVPRLVSQVQDPQWLSVFLAELTDQDITRTMYAGYYKNYTARGPSMINKVERVCSALREAMAQTAEDRELYLQPILSTYVRAGRVGEAITLADSDEALNYLILLMDTDKLYEEALAVYNLEKALRIAGKSLKDPKEYVAYLNELRQMDPAYMKFNIDKRLRKPESALRNLAQCSDRTVECLQFIQDTGLYSIALSLFKDCHEMYNQICLLYGAHLQAKQKYEEAGLMYQRGGDVAKAVSTFTRAGCWQKCLTLAAQHNFSEEALSELHQALYTTLHGSQKYTEAADLCCQLGWLDQAVTCCVEARHWSQAIYFCHTHQRTHLIESAVKPNLLGCQNGFLKDLQAKRAEMDKYSSRLQVVRQRKADMANNSDALSDIQSDTSSLSSYSTSSAGTRTTKNTRKAQRKLWSLKEGNPREEQALLYTITELIQNTERLTGDVHSTCLALAEFMLDSEASTLHSAMTEALEHIQHIKQSVWPTHTVKKTGSDAEAIDPTSIDTQLSFPPASCVSPSWKLNIYT